MFYHVCYIYGTIVFKINNEIQFNKLSLYFSLFAAPLCKLYVGYANRLFKYGTSRKTPKNSDTPKKCCNHPKIWTRWLYLRVMHPKDADWMANGADTDQTAPLGGVWSIYLQMLLHTLADILGRSIWFGSIVFAQACLSENFTVVCRISKRKKVRKNRIF